MKNKPQAQGTRAVVLLSGGLDSATALYVARQRGFKAHCLIFDYGQRHRREIAAARAIARSAGATATVLRVPMPWKGSSLLDTRVPVSGRARTQERTRDGAIPDTYVPARNIIFLSFALSCAEALGAKAIFIGANAVDYSGYPDCRPGFYRAFEKVISCGTKTGVEQGAIKVYAPLIRKTKAQIIRLGLRLGVPYRLTWSCYQGGARPCGACDSCYYRAKGFRQARIADPALTAKGSSR